MDRLVLILDFHAEETTYFKVQIIYTVIRQIVLPCGQAGVHDTFFFLIKRGHTAPNFIKEIRVCYTTKQKRILQQEPLLLNTPLPHRKSKAGAKRLKLITTSLFFRN
jgi:hypothetical protein